MDDDSRDEPRFLLWPSGTLTADGREVPINPRQRLLLAALLAEANEVVPIDRIIAAVWPDGEPHDPRQTMYIYLARLRRHLFELDDADRVRILVEPGGYRMIVDDSRVIASSVAGQVRPATKVGDSTATPERSRRPHSRNESVRRSWFRRAWRNKTVQEVAAVAAHAAESRGVLAQDAQVTATLMQHLGSVIESVQPLENVVIRMGSMLLVKVGDQVAVHNLTPAQQFRLDHQPHLLMSAGEVLAALEVRDGPEPR